MYLNRISLFICFMAFLSLITKSKAKKEPVFCDTLSTKNALNQMVIRRVLMDEENVLLMLKDKRYIFKMPYSFKKQVSLSEFEHFFVKGQTFEEEHNEGHFYRLEDYNKVYGYVQYNIENNEEALYAIYPTE